MSSVDAVDRRPASGDIGAPRVDELLEALVPQQAAVDDAQRADLDDLVAVGRIEPGGLGVEHGVAELGQQPIVELGRPGRGWLNRSKS